MTKIIKTVEGEPGVLNLYLFRDRHFQKTILFKDQHTQEAINLSGYTGKAQIRTTKNSGTLLEEFAVAILGAEGKVVLSLTDAEVTAMNLNPGTSAYWDLVLTDSVNKRLPYLAGTVSMEETVTR